MNKMTDNGAIETTCPCCVMCIHWKRHATGEQNDLGDCHLNPPQPFPMPSQHPLTGQMQLGLQMFRPITRADDYCGYQEELSPGREDVESV